MIKSTTARQLRRFLVIAAAVSAVATPAPTAAAAAQQDGYWWHQQWEMDRVWPISGGDGVTVAVLDTGVDASVPELADSVVPGADFTGQGGDGTVDRDPESHGTTMASLITGGRGVGVAPDATVLPVVVSIGNEESGAFNPAEWIPEGIRYAVDNGAQVINISVAVLTGDCPRPVAEAVRYAADNDAVVVAGTGNEAGGLSGFPGNCPGVLTVGANDAQLNPWADSHRSEHVEVSAPGVGVQMIGSGGRTGTGTGTSNATALVSGVVALMRAEFPDDSADAILRRVIHTAGDIHTDGRDDATGYGVVQPYYALTEELPPGAPNPVYEGLTQGGTDPTDGGLPGADPLAPGDGTPDEASGGVLPVLLAIVGGLLVIAIVVVIIVAVAASGRKKRRPAAHPPQPFAPQPPPFAPQQYPPQQYPPQPPPQPFQGPPGGRR